ncbi:transferase [Colletotrichum graminicola]|uniref:Transferase n=1 Tax=Colletotrichum graminicola (strain M1.001 / M2 / FGSC 10212) TaxID=645133 RepID=E3QSW2_COLGM|nr:transferase [Colletotrichum graminicola M1.001]EFQ33950.1 transferase [Colletotrichum graminicola M1.001]WDK21142.1 transferase [Colletotrichum graminicola]
MAPILAADPAIHHIEVNRRVFPKRQVKSPTTSKLSVIDATVARFTPTAAIWLYDKPKITRQSPNDLFNTITHALSQTLVDYPHFAGQIQWATEDLVKDDVVPDISVGPWWFTAPLMILGSSWSFVKYDVNLDCVIPSRDERAAQLKEWIASGFPQSDFLPPTKIALMSLDAIDGFPAMAVQLTTFKCGGFGISAKISHTLADAITLVNFMHSWAARSRMILGEEAGSSGLELLKPVFDPSQLDKVAGLRHGSSPDPEKIAKARSLPMHRFDWWAEEAPGFPVAVKINSQATMPPPDELSRIELSPSTFPPWETWDMGATVDHAQIRFTADELARMKDAAQASLPDNLKSLRISRLDAALGHIWTLINRARGHQGHEESVYMDITLGLRNRVSLPLPGNFVGSPLLLGYIEKTGDDAATQELGSAAGAIRQMMSRFTPDAVAAYIHDAAQEVSPQRLWQAFLGSHHTLVTSWVKARTYEVDFLGTGDLARYAQGVMPKIDGLVQVMDVGDTGDFDVSLCIKQDAMDRLLKDSLLRRYAGSDF